MRFRVELGLFPCGYRIHNINDHLDCVTRTNNRRAVLKGRGGRKRCRFYPCNTEIVPRVSNFALKNDQGPGVVRESYYLSLLLPYSSTTILYMLRRKEGGGEREKNKI